MVWFLMQPADNEESQRGIGTFQETSECIFDLGKNGERLKPIAFGLISCAGFERKYHSFVGEM